MFTLNIFSCSLKWSPWVHSTNHVLLAFPQIQTDSVVQYWPLVGPLTTRHPGHHTNYRIFYLIWSMPHLLLILNIFVYRIQKVLWREMAAGDKRVTFRICESAPWERWRCSGRRWRTQRRWWWRPTLLNSTWGGNQALPETFYRAGADLFIDSNGKIIKTI